ncbi:MAG: beta-N-acetylhexosaminidase [Burkholderiales bacterium]|nr:beta-N-acetylhexosaminidase [Burkholderiales bacterium]
MRVERPSGPVVLDLSGPMLEAGDRELLLHPAVGGVILFKRNYVSPGQLAALASEIHALRAPGLLIAVDHEGGRVQRFVDGFTRLPPMRSLGALFERDPELAGRLAHAIGLVLAAELRERGVDLSFAPVVDVDFGASSVIGDRAFHHTPHGVARLAAQLAAGMSAAGMGAVAKHFPGHGFVRGDSHLEVPVDERTFAEIDAADLMPYRALIGQGLAGVMPAHVIYPEVDAAPAGFSALWLREILRERLGFDGLVFSDDLSMEGARVAGDIVARGRAALTAGCDMVLVCNDRPAAERLVEGLGGPPPEPRRVARFNAGSAEGSGRAGYRGARQLLAEAQDAGMLA